MKNKELRSIIREEIEKELNEARLLDLKSLVPKMVLSVFGPRTDAAMRDELQKEIEKAIFPILQKYDYIVKKD